MSMSKVQSHWKHKPLPASPLGSCSRNTRLSHYDCRTTLINVESNPICTAQCPTRRVTNTRQSTNSKGQSTHRPIRIDSATLKSAQSDGPYADLRHEMRGWRAGKQLVLMAPVWSELLADRQWWADALKLQQGPHLRTDIWKSPTSGLRRRTGCLLSGARVQIRKCPAIAQKSSYTHWLGHQQLRKRQDQRHRTSKKNGIEKTVANVNTGLRVFSYACDNT